MKVLTTSNNVILLIDPLQFPFKKMRTFLNTYRY